MEILLSTIPVLLFLFFLFLLDSFKLVHKETLCLAILWGIVCAGLMYFLNTFILEENRLTFEVFSRYIAPATEEIAKSLFIFLLLFRKKIGFMIDAAVYGFAIGAGFSLVENCFYFYNVPDAGLLVWIIRGFGTAFMHGGCTALIAVILISTKNRETPFSLSLFISFFSAYIIHAVFNHFYLNPLIQTIGIIVLLPIIFILIFNRNEKQLQHWLEIEFSSEIELLQLINKGQFSGSRAGEYLASLKSRFSPEVIVDMYCYIRLYLELSIKAKRNMMLRENGFPPIREDDMEEKLHELHALKKQIGKVGEITLAPLIRMNYRDLWKLSMLK
jgi:RsiW-degrading membrane proteinase PrsW (M82 family)